MKCNLKTMIWTGAVLFLGAGIAYVVFDGARATIVASLPLLAVLLCPISMLVMMKFMHSSKADSCSGAVKTEGEGDAHRAKDSLQLSK